MTPAVSIVVPTYNRADLLDRLLAALTAQTFDPSGFEIIIADNAGSEATRLQTERWRDRSPMPIRYVRADHARGPAAARNAGVRAAAGPIIAFTDDDTVPEPGWLAAGVAALGAGNDAARGRIVMPLPERPTDYERNESGLESAGFVTANCFCRRAAFEAVGGFDERFTAAWREDSDLYFNLLKSGCRVVRAPGAVVVHPVRPAKWGVSLGQQRKSLFNALLYKKHPTMYRRWIQAMPPIRYYAAIGAGLTALAAAASACAGIAWAAAVLWGFLTAGFCLQRLRGTSRDPGHIAEMVVTSILIPPLAVYWRLRGAVRFRTLFL